MRPFAFPLKRVRDYKEQIFDKEKETLAKYRSRQRELELELQENRAYLAEKRERLSNRQRLGIKMAEIHAAQSLIAAAERSIQEMEQRVEEAQAATAAQLKIVLAQSKEISSLDKLEEKKREEYLHEAAKEFENLILENLTTQLAFHPQQQ